MIAPSDRARETKPTQVYHWLITFGKKKIYWPIGPFLPLSCHLRHAASGQSPWWAARQPAMLKL
jgi:hypothetical protein